MFFMCPGNGSSGDKMKNGMKWLKATLGLMLALFIATGLYLSFRNHFRREGRSVRLQEAALADLALIRDAQVQFHTLHDTYTTDLSSLGIKPRYVYYKIGF